jgi:AbrB family looped-hinge helix DNA binding protein
MLAGSWSSLFVIGCGCAPASDRAASDLAKGADRLTMRLTRNLRHPVMDTVTLSSKGQLVIPKAVRKHAQVAPGSKFSVRYVDGEIRLRPLAPEPAVTLDEVAGCLAHPERKRLSDAQTQATIQARLKARHAP